MAKKKTKALVSSDSETESLDFKPEIAHHSDDETDYNSVNSGDELDENEHLPSSTTIEGKSMFTVKLKLANILRQYPVSLTKHCYAVKKLPWNEIKIDGYTTKQLESLLQEIVKSVGHIRTLDEILADYTENHIKKDRAIHPDFPVIPKNPGMRYLLENRQKFETQMEAEMGAKQSYSQVFKYAFEKFKALPDKKKEKYVNAYKADKEEYHKKRAEFYKKHPEMTPKAVTKEKRAKKVKKPAESSQLTPFNYYRDLMAKGGNIFATSVAQKMWRNLSKSEKVKYINDVANMDTEREKKITKIEWKLLNEVTGVPDKPNNVYTIFMKKFRETYVAKNKESSTFVTDAAKTWAAMKDSEKNKYKLELEGKIEEWKKEVEKYIKKQPLEQQPMLFAKYNFCQEKTPRKRKAETAEEPLKTEVNATVAKKEHVEVKKDEEPESPKKKKKEEPESPKKKKKQKLSEPEFPSQSTAHYFMKYIYSGKASKVGKAYRKLDPEEKKEHHKEMKIRRKKFLIEVSAYIATLEASEAEKYRLKMRQEKMQQGKDISWHVNSGTDDEKKVESSSDSSSDSDSS